MLLDYSICTACLLNVKNHKCCILECAKTLRDLKIKANLLHVKKSADLKKENEFYKDELQICISNKNRFISLPNPDEKVDINIKIEINEMCSKVKILQVKTDITIYNNISPNLVDNIEIKFNDLPTELEYFCCENFYPLDIDNLPSGLKKLRCNSNKLKKINNLPFGLRLLDCSNNEIENLDFIPENLIYLNCSNNHLTKLDNLPMGLKYLMTSGNNIDTHINIPDGLEQLNEAKFCNGMDQKKSLEFLSGYKKYISEQQLKKIQNN